MRFKDEKHMWYAETEIIAAELANKSEQEVQDILDDWDVITLRSGDRPKAKMINRLALVVLYLPLMALTAVKWCYTGDRYLDSWAKRNSVLNTVMKFAGLTNE